MWERGLKYVVIYYEDEFGSVAPHVGAWIEIRCVLHNRHRRTSLPMWERGLKLLWLSAMLCCTESLPMWERGLKFPQPRQMLSGLRRSPCGSVD